MISVVFFSTGQCMEVMDTESVSDHCERVRSSSRCETRSNCANMVLPSDGCCPICGKVVIVLLCC